MRPDRGPLKTVAIVQARTGSHRLPGKVLTDISGRPMLERVLARLRRCPALDAIVVATSTAAGDDAIVSACQHWGMAVFRGSEDDVLDRFYQAARIFSAGVCMRITADCPLLDPSICALILQRFQAAWPAIDYASNTIEHTFPRGLDAEVFTYAALEKTRLLATQAYERAHVTAFIYQHPELFRLCSVTQRPARPDLRWTVDTPEDLEFVRQVYRRLGPGDEFGQAEVLQLLEQEPQLSQINAHIRQKAIREG